MREAIFLGLVGAIFLVYEFLVFLWHSLPAFDPFFPLLLSGFFWRLRPAAFWGAVVTCGLLVDLFSSKFPGPTVLAYIVALLIFRELKKRLALRGFFPALLSLILAISLCEILRLAVFPALFEINLPEPAFYFVGKITIFTLGWGFLCWLFCQLSLVRHVFELSKHHRA